jgi:hypothetical protein
VCVYIHTYMYFFFSVRGGFLFFLYSAPRKFKKRKKENRPAMTTCELRITHRVHPCI